MNALNDFNECYKSSKDKYNEKIGEMNKEQLDKEHFTCLETYKSTLRDQVPVFKEIYKGYTKNFNQGKLVDLKLLEGDGEFPELKR